MTNRNYSNNCHTQRHVHEIIGSTETITECNDCHNHRFCTVSDEAIQVMGNDHVHEIKYRTDFADGHYHEFCGNSSCAVEVGGGKHVHYATACTEDADGHVHRFQVASLIDSPTDYKCTCRP